MNILSWDVRDEDICLLLRNARKFKKMFEIGWRVDPADAARRKSYWRLADDRAEWMQAAVHEAHGDLLPDDSIYQRCASAIDYIVSLDPNDQYDEGNMYDLMYEWAEQEMGPYIHHVIEWLSEYPVTRLALCDEVREDMGGSPTEVPTEQILRLGWERECCNIFTALWRACAKDHSDEEKSDDA